MATDRGQRYHLVEYSNWQQGCSFKKNRRITDGTDGYQSINMQVYDNGMLGVRPWLRSWDTWTTGLTLTDTIDPYASIQARDGATTKGELYVLFLSGDIAFYRFNDSSWTYDTTLDAVGPLLPDNKAYVWTAYNTRALDSNGTLIGTSCHQELPSENWVIGGEAIYDTSIAGSGHAETDIDWTPTGVTAGTITNFCWYRDRIYGWALGDNNTLAESNRVYYTDAGSYTTVSATNHFDIGAKSNGYWITGVWPLRDSLLIAMSNGDWYAYTGVPGTATLRYIGKYVVPMHGAAGAVYQNTLFFPAPFGRGLCIATPSGVDYDSLSHVQPHVEDINWPEEQMHDYRTLVSTQRNVIATHHLRTKTDQWWVSCELANNAWMYHQYGEGSFDPTTSNLGYLRDVAVHDGGRSFDFLVEDPDSPHSTEVHLYTREVFLNRPSHKSDQWSDSKEVAVGDTATQIATGALRLAPFSVPTGKKVRVSRVTVDFAYWYDTGNDFYETPTIKAAQVDAAGVTEATVDTFTGTDLDTFEDKGLSGDNEYGLIARHVFHFDPNVVDAFASVQVELNTIQSIAIDRVQVEYEILDVGHYDEVL